MITCSIYGALNVKCGWLRTNSFSFRHEHPVCITDIWIRDSAIRKKYCWGLHSSFFIYVCQCLIEFIEPQEPLLLLTTGWDKRSQCIWYFLAVSWNSAARRNGTPLVFDTGGSKRALQLVDCRRISSTLCKPQEYYRSWFPSSGISKKDIAEPSCFHRARPISFMGKQFGACLCQRQWQLGWDEHRGHAAGLGEICCRPLWHETRNHLES